ncbi:MAG TPA: enoyl-CoA hydratase/isomerase family protein [Jatrophihabitantaceae bacterium]
MDESNIEAPVVRERIGAIEILRLNRPDKRNALDSAGLARLICALEELCADDALRVLVLSTTNVRAFCAGADVGEVLDREGGVARMSAFTRLYTLIEQFPVPTIAVCVGNCVGAGAEIVAGCDLRVGGDNLKLSWAGARLGIPVGPARLVPLVGLARAKDLVLTGRVVGMAQAEAYGLLQRAAAADEAEAAALELAAALAAQSADGIGAIMAMFRELESTGQRVAYENDRLMDFQRRGGGLPTG